MQGYHGTEFENAKLNHICAENGIYHDLPAPITPQQNGVVERKNKTLVDIARLFLIESNLPKYF